VLRSKSSVIEVATVSAGLANKRQMWGWLHYKSQVPRKGIRTSCWVACNNRVLRVSNLVLSHRVLRSLIVGGLRGRGMIARLPLHTEGMKLLAVEGL
jgi:hypothetical protein